MKRRSFLTASLAAGTLASLQPSLAVDEEKFDPTSLEALRAGMGAGTVQAQVEWEDLQATVYGDVAVSTGYLVGTWTVGGGSREGRWRETIVWLRQGQSWQVAHLHVSECLA